MFVYTPTGVIPQYWFPETTGRDFAFPRTVKPFEKFRHDILFLTNLAHHNSLSLGDGPGDHARAAATYLTGMHIKKTEGTDLRDGISADQIAARKFAAETRFPSLELTCEDSRQAGACDSYSCAYQNMLVAIRDVAAAARDESATVFERLFGDLDITGDPAARARQQAYRTIYLDITLRARRNSKATSAPRTAASSMNISPPSVKSKHASSAPRKKCPSPPAWRNPRESLLPSPNTRSCCSRW